MTQLINTKIAVSNEKADAEARTNWNTLCFLLSACIDKIDELKETNVFNKQLKFHINQALKLMIKETNTHYKSYETHGKIVQNDETLAPIHTRDLYNITSKSYDFILNKKPHEICSIVQMIKTMEEKGLDYTTIDIPFQPLKE